MSFENAANASFLLIFFVKGTNWKLEIWKGSTQIKNTTVSSSDENNMFSVDGLIALLAVSGLLVAGLGVAGLCLLVPGLGLLVPGLGLLISRLGLLIPGLWLRAAEGRLLGVSLLRTIVGAGPLVVTHSYLLVQHGKRFL